MRTYLLLLVLFLASCASSGRHLQHTSSVMPNESGRQHFLAAYRAWEAAQAGKMDPIQALLAARGSLRMAQSSDSGVPLYFSQEGLVALELAGHYGQMVAGAAEAADYLGLAERAFGAALSIRSDWSPAHVGLAELARREGRERAAQQHLAQARQAVAAMDAAWNAEAGLEARPFRRAGRTADTKPTHAQELAILRGQLEEAARWGLAIAPIAAQDASATRHALASL